jgi:hypothetical protein
MSSKNARSVERPSRQLTPVQPPQVGMTLEDYQVYLKNYTLYVNYVQMRRSAASERTPPKEKRQKPQKVTKEPTPDSLEKAAEAKRQRKLAKNRRRRLSRRTRKLAATAKILEGTVRVATLERKLAKVSASAKAKPKEKQTFESYAAATKVVIPMAAKEKKDTTPTKQPKVSAVTTSAPKVDIEAAKIRKLKQERRAAQLSASEGGPVVHEVPSYENPAEVADALGAQAFSGRQYTPSPVATRLPSPFMTGASTPTGSVETPFTPYQGFREVLPAGPSVPAKSLPRAGGLNVSSNPDDVDPAVRQAWYQKGTGNVIYFKGTTIDQVAPASGNGRSYKGKKYYLSHSYAVNG